MLKNVQPHLLSAHMASAVTKKTEEWKNLRHKLTALLFNGYQQDRRFLFLQNKNPFSSTSLLLLLSLFVFFRSTQACSTRSYGPVSPTVCLWTKNCCLSWWRRQAMPLIWWENGIWACTKRTACLHDGVLTHTLVNINPEKDWSCSFLRWTGNWTSLHCLLRLFDRQRELLYSHPLSTHLCSKSDSLCPGPAGGRNRCHKLHRKLFHWAV